MKENRYNLIDEKWIPTAGKGKVGLRTVFSDESITSLGGNPIEKIAVFKLLLAIAQSACTPEDEKEWEKLGLSGLKQKVLDYLDKHYDRFWLYGEHPFLQINEIEKAKLMSFGDVQLEIATGNTSVVTEIQSEKPLSDAEKALLVLTLMGFACGGKKTDNSVVLSKGYVGKTNDKGKPSTGKPGSSLGFMGFLHSFIVTQNVSQSIYLNLFTKAYISDLEMFPGGVGMGPWVQMPKGEDDAIAQNAKKSYMGRLLPLNRFVLLADKGIHYSEGINHNNYSEFIVDPSIAVDFSAKPKPKVIWVDPERRPWRQLTSLLAFLGADKSTGYNCYQLRGVLGRCKNIPSFSVWSGGVRVSSNAGEQFLTGTDDFVDSEVQLSSSILEEESSFFGNLSDEMKDLESIAKILYGKVLHYYANLMTEGKLIAAKSTNMYWQMCEGDFQKLVNVCASDLYNNSIKELRIKFLMYALQIYDSQCPNQTARQLEAWAKNRPFTRLKVDA